MKKNQLITFVLFIMLCAFAKSISAQATSMTCPYRILNYTSCALDVGYEIFTPGCVSTSPPCAAVVSIPAAIGSTPGSYVIPAGSPCCPVPGSRRDIFVDPKKITGCLTCFVYMHQSVNGVFTCPSTPTTPMLNSTEVTTSAVYPVCGVTGINDQWFPNHTEIH